MREVPEEVLDRFRGDADYQYLHAQPQSGPSQTDRFWAWLRDLFEGTGEQWSLAFDIVLYGSIAAVLIFAVFWLLKMRPTDMFTRREPAHPGLRMTEDDFEGTDFAAVIREAEAREAYRDAVRYHYLHALRRLSDREAIRWTPDKTNDEYRRELKETPYAEAFDGVTYIFEHVWYGHTELSADRYEQVRPTLNALHHRLERGAAEVAA